MTSRTLLKNIPVGFNFFYFHLFCRLAEDYPDCLMLNFTIKLISDAGFQVSAPLLTPR